MDVEEAILRRRSVRAYEDKEVPEGKLESVLDAARMALSAYNNQDWKFIVVRDEGKRAELYKAADEQDHVIEAPVIIAGVALDPENEMPCGVSGGIVDLAIALDHITLKAAEEGLGTCWIGNFRQEKAKDVLGVPEDQKIISMITLGHPEKGLDKLEKSRKSLGEITSFDRF